MPGIGASTRTFMSDWEGRSNKRYTVLGGPEEDIGIGYMLVTPQAVRLDNRRYWNSPSRGRLVDLFNEVLSNQEVDELFDFVATNPADGFSTAPIQYGIPNLNQNQFDSLFSWHYTYGSSFSRQINLALRNIIRKYITNLRAGYNDIFNTWTKWSTSGGKFYRGIYIRRVAEFMLFFGKQVSKNYLDQLTRGATTQAECYERVKGIVFQGQTVPPYTPSDNASTEPTERNGASTSEDEVNNPNLDLEATFEQIENERANLELDNVNKSWGSRNTALEESDWIGLKQYLLYLCSLYYPQDLIPFAELIPVYSLDPPENSNQLTEFQKKRYGGSITYMQQQKTFYGVDGTASPSDTDIPAIQNDFFKSSTGLDYDRYRNTSTKLNSLLETGGADLLTIDPFQEVSNALNSPNETGQEVIKQRGYGYKIFGSITLTPGVIDGALSKAGAIGFTSISIDSGSISQNAMSLINISLLDVQGNKFTDINSPWSFLLNGSSKQGGDFYFRYGWQIRVPKAKVGSSNNFVNPDDLNAEKFWNHPGWALFNKETKIYILETASAADNTITLTQSTDPESFRTPGYMLEQKSEVFEIRLDRKLDPLKYLSLTLVNPEISVNPQDGSITATLSFRTQGAVANCLTNLSGANNMYNLFSNTDARTTETNLLNFITAFLQDNKDYVNSLNSKKINPKAVVNPIDARSWIQVIGVNTPTNSTTGDANIDPADVPIKIPDTLLGELNRTYQSKRDTRLLIEWINEVLDKNDCKILSVGDQQLAGNNITGALVIAYEGKELPNNQNISDPSALFNLNTSGSTRIQQQDDVFSFRFKGSLIESFNIEKIETTTEQTNEARLNLATEIINTGDDNNTVTGKTANEVQNQGNLTSTQQQNKFVYRNERNISIADKKRNLAILYSQMLKATVSCIAHPWLKIGKFVNVKGTGFFDGKYMVTRLVHTWELDNKFVSSVELVRAINQNDFKKKQEVFRQAQIVSLNKAGIQKAEPVKPPLINQPTQTIINATNPAILETIPIGPTNTTPVTQTINSNPNAALAKKIFSTAFAEMKNTKSSYFIPDFQLSKYSKFFDQLSFPLSSNSYNIAFVNWVIFKAGNSTQDQLPFSKNLNIQAIKAQFASNNKLRNYTTNTVVNYIPKIGDIAFFGSTLIGIVCAANKNNLNSIRLLDLEFIYLKADNLIYTIANNPNQFYAGLSNLTEFGVI